MITQLFTAEQLAETTTVVNAELTCWLCLETVPALVTVTKSEHTVTVCESDAAFLPEWKRVA